MKILIACEESGTVRDEFTRRGHDAMSCDLLPSRTQGKHYQGDVRDVLYRDWDALIAFPPCTFLTVTGNKWFKPEYADRFPTRHQDRADAIAFFMLFANATHIAYRAIENPVGIMSTVYRAPDQVIHPYYFGDPHSKATCLWLEGFPLLRRTHFDVTPQFVNHSNGKRDPLWHYETMRLPAPERAKARSKTFDGIARAMGEQWGNLQTGKRIYQMRFEYA